MLLFQGTQKVNKVKLAITGSRDIFPNEHYIVWQVLNEYLHKHDSELIIVCGMARGVDMVAYNWAKNYNVPVIEMPAEWDKFGKRAGYKRNIEMIDLADEVASFWNGTSSGTKHAINYAIKKGKPIRFTKISK